MDEWLESDENEGETHYYLFELDYGERESAKRFIKALIAEFDTDTMVGAGIHVNNNPYSLEAYFFAFLEKDHERFEEFTSAKFPERRRLYNVFIPDFMNSMANRGYNAFTFVDEATVDFAFEGGVVFLFPPREKLKAMGMTIREGTFRSFLCHSSKDKHIVDLVFDALQKAEINAWYDKYEIRAGDSITEKINEGLSRSDIGVLVISKNFVAGAAAWAKTELGYFLHERMTDARKRFLVLNVDLEDSELPPLVRDFRYIKYAGGAGIIELIEELKHSSDQKA